jgi:hypothetical protein
MDGGPALPEIYLFDAIRAGRWCLIPAASKKCRIARVHLFAHAAPPREAMHDASAAICIVADGCASPDRAERETRAELNSARAADGWRRRSRRGRSSSCLR